ncbi:MAG: glycerol-3-phosphate dehydrogenase/oxidase [Cyanobacteria bacterium P01_A01_bin.135]
MRDLSIVQNSPYDLIVIGGGINGAGAARDAALRGLKTLLIEKDDFGSGSTSWSTRLIHGGLRYLEYFEFKLVRESLREREILLSTAPHLVKPIQMTIPIYKGGRRSYWEIQAGMLLYDVLSFDKTLPNHRMLPAKKLQQMFRSVTSDEVVGAAQYYDCQVEYAERLCLENIVSAQAAGADAFNYVEVSEIRRQGDRITEVTCSDVLTGEAFTARLNPQGAVINTGGPWVDLVNERGKQPLTPKRLMGGTKGSHILVDPFPGAPDTALYVEAKSDGRPYFIVPWCGMYLIGTTDLRYEGRIEDLKASNDEVDYLISETNQVLPMAQLSRDQVRFTYSGLRPLPYTEGTKTSGITRSHILYDHQEDGVANLVSLVGGKLTTFRQVGEELVDWAYKKRGEAAPDCPTRHQPFPGAISAKDVRIGQAIAAHRQISRQSIDHLFQIYGARATEVLALVEQSPELGEPITPELPDIKAQAVYAVESEMARTLVDICRRRTVLAMHSNYGFELLPVITQVLSEHCGWDSGHCDRQIEDYRKFMERNCQPDYAMAAVPV